MSVFPKLSFANIHKYQSLPFSPSGVFIVWLVICVKFPLYVVASAENDASVGSVPDCIHWYFNVVVFTPAEPVFTVAVLLSVMFIVAVCSCSYWLIVPAIFMSGAMLSNS